jgi:hypothetical protein
MGATCPLTDQPGALLAGAVEKFDKTKVFHVPQVRTQPQTVISRRRSPRRPRRYQLFLSLHSVPSPPRGRGPRIFPVPPRQGVAAVFELVVGMPRTPETRTLC